MNLFHNVYSDYTEVSDCAYLCNDSQLFFIQFYRSFIHLDVEFVTVPPSDLPVPILGKLIM